MATKTFKIGLSNTDKQNMAQDVYERVLALTFAEYDSANTYNEGDFVVYDDTLYQCKQDNTTGTWDSSKWQQATLQDLLDDVEGAVASVNDKANVDGNYPTLTSGAADNLTPYSEDSGDDQNEPFIVQGTGCGNGTEQVDTGSLALLKEKRGNSVVVNQQVNGLASGTEAGVTLTTSGNKITINGTAEGLFSISQNQISIISGHKYLFWFGNNPQGYIFVGGSNTWKNESVFIFDASWSDTDRLNINSTYTYDNLILEPYVIDLTQWFGSNDNIPSDLLSHPEAFFNYYQGSLAYNTGAIVNANGQFLKCVGRNVWDEEWELGTLNDNNGNNQNADDKIRSKNLIKVIPNETYYFYLPSALSRLIYYDKDKQFISAELSSVVNGATKTMPSNCCYIRFSIAGTSYANNVTISIYYEGESGYDQYYPYTVLTNVDTGNEVLRSAGNVRDSKDPSGKITRRVGVVDLGELNWTYGQNGRYYADVPSNLKLVGTNETPNWTCNTYEPKNASTDLSSSQNAICLYSGKFYTYASSSSAPTPTGTLYYELAEETEEQGTSFSENVNIDDFGAMEISATSFNGVPMGNLIFYPVDYKAFLDSLFNELSGSADKVLSTNTSQSDLDDYLNGKGYYKQENKSADVTDNAGLTYNTKKIYKVGNVVYLTMQCVNGTGSNISANTKLFTLDSSIKAVTTLDLPFIIENVTSPATLTLEVSGGSVRTKTEIASGKYFFISICYAVA